MKKAEQSTARPNHRRAPVLRVDSIEGFSFLVDCRVPAQETNRRQHFDWHRVKPE